MTALSELIGTMPPGLDRAILRILSFHKGLDNAISRSDMIADCRRMGFRVQDRPMRFAINQLRKQGHPICSTGGEGGGYYLATNRAELEDYIMKEAQARINDLSEQIKAMRTAFPPDNQMRLI